MTQRSHLGCTDIAYVLNMLDATLHLHGNGSCHVVSISMDAKRNLHIDNLHYFL